MNRRRYLVIVGIVAAAVLISILSYTTLANHGLAITSLNAAPEVVPLGGSCQIVCSVTAPRGDVLSYDWSSTGGQITVDEITGEGATAAWTGFHSAGSYNVTVTVTDSHGGQATKQLTITVTARANNPPTITSLVANASWTAPSGTIEVTCTASDLDGDELSYEWMATGGEISGAGAAVNWTAPESIGAYNITVVVEDGWGGEVTRIKTLSVVLGPPPTIEKLVVTPVGNPQYLRKSLAAGCDFDVWMLKQYDIECIASNTSDELSYEWSCTAGNISGEGSTITWKAPNEKSVQVTVTVIVSDAENNSIAKNMVLHVPSCTCGSWGLKSGEIPF
jgi:hypothetical protein